MRAVTFRGVRDVVVRDVADPELVEAGDALVRVRLGAICGSDLHPYLGREVGLDAGTVLGHEFVGEVVAVSHGVASFAPGDRVVAPFSTSCGACFYCARGLTARCERGQLFGWRQQGRGLHGAQAELVRVPLAASTLVRVPDGVDDEHALLTGDVLSTGFQCARAGGVQAGHAVAVVGTGPVGVCAVVAATRMGATVFAFDPAPERRALARRYGAVTEGAHEALRDATAGRGADVVLECVGSPQATRTAFDLARPGAVISAAGVHCEPTFAFSPGEAYDKNLTYRAGRCSARAAMDETMALVQTDTVDLGPLFSHRLPLAEAPHGYRIFSEHRDGCTKVLLTP